MSNQKTPLNDKAISIVDIEEFCFDSNHDNEKLVWLSDAEAEIQKLTDSRDSWHDLQLETLKALGEREAEIQQLKNDLGIVKDCCIQWEDKYQKVEDERIEFGKYANSLLKEKASLMKQIETAKQMVQALPQKCICDLHKDDLLKILGKKTP